MNIFRKIRPLRHIRRGYCAGAKPEANLDPEVRITILPNGVRVATEWKRSPLASITLYVEAGPRFEASCYHGITHFVEHLAFKDYKTLKQKELERLLQREIATMSVKTSREIQTFSARCLNDSSQRIVDILSKTVTEMEISDKTVEQEKEKIYLEMEDHDNDPRAVVFDYLHMSAFQGTPLAKRVIGPTRCVQNFDRNMALTHVYEQYQPYKLCLASSGELDHDFMVKYAETTLGRMTADPAFESQEGPTRYCGSQITYRDDSMSHAHIAIAFEAPGFGCENYEAFRVAKCMMGNWHKSQNGGYGLGSPLARAASVSGFAESIETFYITYRDVGLWGVYFVGNRMHLDDMICVIQDQLMKMCTMLVSTDLEYGVKMAQLELARNVEGTWRSAHDIGQQVLYTSKHKSLASTFQELCGLDAKECQDIFAKVFYDKCPVIVGVGPTEDLLSYSRLRLGQYWLRV